jgi:hypothetical protein
MKTEIRQRDAKTQLTSMQVFPRSKTRKLNECSIISGRHPSAGGFELSNQAISLEDTLLNNHVITWFFPATSLVCLLWYNTK